MTKREMVAEIQALQGANLAKSQIISQLEIRIVAQNKMIDKMSLALQKIAGLTAAPPSSRSIGDYARIAKSALDNK